MMMMMMKIMLLSATLVAVRAASARGSMTGNVTSSEGSDEGSDESDTSISIGPHTYVYSPSDRGSRAAKEYGPSTTRRDEKKQPLTLDLDSKLPDLPPPVSERLDQASRSTTAPMCPRMPGGNRPTSPVRQKLGIYPDSMAHVEDSQLGFNIMLQHQRNLFKRYKKDSELEAPSTAVWRCSRCTYDNPVTDVLCDMCGAKNPEKVLAEGLKCEVMNGTVKTDPFVTLELIEDFRSKGMFSLDEFITLKETVMGSKRGAENGKLAEFEGTKKFAREMAKWRQSRLHWREDIGWTFSSMS